MRRTFEDAGEHNPSVARSNLQSGAHFSRQHRERESGSKTDCENRYSPRLDQSRHTGPSVAAPTLRCPAPRWMHRGSRAHCTAYTTIGSRLTFTSSRICRRHSSLVFMIDSIVPITQRRSHVGSSCLSVGNIGQDMAVFSDSSIFTSHMYGNCVLVLKSCSTFNAPPLQCDCVTPRLTRA